MKVKQRITKKLIAGIIGFGAGATAAYTSARSSYPNQPPSPGFFETLLWLCELQDGWAIAAALFAFISAALVIWEAFKPDPPTIEEIGTKLDEIIAPVGRNVDEFSAQVWREGQLADERHAESIASGQTTQDLIRRNKIQLTLDELKRPDADPKLIEEFDRVIRVAKEDDVAISQENAATIAETAVRVGRSNRPGDDEIAKLIEQGEYRAAAKRKAELAKARIEEREKQEAAELRDAANLALPFAPTDGKTYLETAVELDPNDFWSWIELGRLRALYESLDSAELAFKIGFEQVANDRDRMVVHTELENLFLARGETDKAFEEHTSTHAILLKLCKESPENVDLQRDLSVHFNRRGYFMLSAGEVVDARLHFQAAFAISERLAALKPHNAGLLCDLAICYTNLGTVEIAAKNYGVARNFLEKGLVIKELLAEQNPDNMQLQRDRLVSYSKLGELEQAEGKIPEARAQFELGLAVAENLAAAEPGNSLWQVDLGGFHFKLGDLALRGNGRELALKHFCEAERIMQALVEEWPNHHGFANDLAEVQSVIARIKGDTDS